jgi:transposase InsO family protein
MQRATKLKESKRRLKIKNVVRTCKRKNLGEIVQIDSVCLNENGLKRYFITAIDVCGRQAYAKEYKMLNSDNAKDFMTKLRSRFAYKIKSVQTDNGLEFYKRFDDYLKVEKITHYWNYSRSPKSNAYIERFNRTLREQFFDAYQYDLTDIKMWKKTWTIT